MNIQTIHCCTPSQCVNMEYFWDWISVILVVEESMCKMTTEQRQLCTCNIQIALLNHTIDKQFKIRWNSLVII